MKTLITGAAGFIGFHLAKNLIDQGEKLILIDNFSRGRPDDDFKSLIENQNVTFVNADLTIENPFDELDQEISRVYHLAAINGTENFYNIPDTVLRVNILSTLNLLEWAKRNLDVKIVFSSSSEVYAGSLKNGLGSIPTNENIPLCINDISNVRWSYGASKLLCENALFSYNKRYGVRFSIIRFHNIYGTRMGFKHVMPQFFERIFVKNENPLKIYGGNQTRAFCHISDALKALKLIMELDQTDKMIINIGNDEEEVKINYLAELIIKLTDNNNSIVNKKAPEGSTDRRCPDISLLKSLGYNPTVSLQEGLKPMIQWYKNEFGKLDDKK